MEATFRGRFAPSPSGEIHLGNAWAALLAWLQVRHAGGAFVLRVEDLDSERCRSEYISALIEDLQWLGLDWDEGPDRKGEFSPYLQSARQEYYEKALQSLRRKDLIYPCFCTRADIRAAASAPHSNSSILRYPGTCRELNFERINAVSGRVLKNYSYRFKLRDCSVSFHDLVYGPYVINPYRELGDFILQRSDEIFAYQLAVVVDDGEMQITHVLRGSDLLPSTSQQILLFQSLGYPVPEFAHIPLLYGVDGRRLSKRHGAITLRHFREQGVKPEQIIGQLGYWAGLLDKLISVQARELIPYFDLYKLPRHEIIVKPEILFRESYS